MVLVKAGVRCVMGTTEPAGGGVLKQAQVPNFIFKGSCN